MIELAVFIVLSVGMLLFSWRFLKAPRSHGFYRFFAFECILALVIINAEQWFRNPFSALQIVSWVSLISSAILAAHGFYLLRVIGQPEGGIENTTRVVEVGAYKYIRHPLYGSLLLLGVGAFLKTLSVVGMALLLVMTGALVMTARVEERENVERFGSEYEAYMKRTRMFIPYVF